jgi:bromodomain adjacent to zinc finger domain protein 1A
MNVLLGGTKTDGEAAAPEIDGADEEGAVEDSSDLSDISEGSETLSSTSVRDKKSRRQRERQSAQHAKQREIARAKVASAKQAQAEHRRLDEEVNKLERRLEGIEREFRKLLGSIRVKPLGKDRFYNRIWWFDGMGSASLLGSGGVVQYGAGRLFIQGPSQFDLELLEKRKDEVVPRRKEEEGEQGMLGANDWGVYTDLEEVRDELISWFLVLNNFLQVDDFMAWLNPKGIRETALKTALSKWWSHITLGIRKRIGVGKIYSHISALLIKLLVLRT